MQGVKDSSGLYEVERRARHAERPGFRINELQISPTQQVPWHFHTNIQDTFYVLAGELRIFSGEKKIQIALVTLEVRPSGLLDLIEQRSFLWRLCQGIQFLNQNTNLLAVLGPAG